jgi:hypothetical protein
MVPFGWFLAISPFTPFYYDCQSGFIANYVPFLWLSSKLFSNGPNLYIFLNMWIRFSEQLRSLQTNVERKNVQCILAY